MIATNGKWRTNGEREGAMTVDIGADTIAVLVGLLTLAIALWAQIWRTDAASGAT